MIVEQMKIVYSFFGETRIGAWTSTVNISDQKKWTFSFHSVLKLPEVEIISVLIGVKKMATESLTLEAQNKTKNHAVCRWEFYFLHSD